MRRTRWLCVGILALSGCALKSAGKGEECARSTQCTPGLVCVKGTCSTNLISIAKQSSVPNLMPEEDAGAKK